MKYLIITLSFLLSIKVTAQNTDNLRNGKEYNESYIQPTCDDNQFFCNIALGEIKYFGIVYKNIPLAYDIVKDEIIILYNLDTYISLYNEQIEYFIINKHKFIRKNDTYYEIIDNKLIRHTKKYTYLQVDGRFCNVITSKDWILTSENKEIKLKTKKQRDEN